MELFLIRIILWVKAKCPPYRTVGQRKLFADPPLPGGSFRNDADPAARDSGSAWASVG